MFVDKDATAEAAGESREFLYTLSGAMIVAVSVGFPVNRRTQRKEMAKIRPQFVNVQRTQERMLKKPFPAGETDDGEVHTDD